MQLDFLVICANLQHADKMDFLTHYHDFQEMLTINYCFQTRDRYKTCALISFESVQKLFI